MMCDELFEMKNVLRNASNEENQRCNYRSVSVSLAGIGRQTNCYLGYFLMRACSRMGMTIKLRGLAIHIQTLFWIQKACWEESPYFLSCSDVAFVAMSKRALSCRASIDVQWTSSRNNPFGTFLVGRDHMAQYPVSLF